MHKQYCKRCHQPLHGYMNLCPEGDYNDGQDRYVPEKIIEIEWDEWPVEGYFDRGNNGNTKG